MNSYVKKSSFQDADAMMQIFDKLCQSFGSDVLQVLMNSAENVATCSHHVLLSEMLRLTLDQCIAVFSSDILTIDGTRSCANNVFVGFIRLRSCHDTVFFNYSYFSIHSSSWHKPLQCQQPYGHTTMLY